MGSNGLSPVSDMIEPMRLDRQMELSKWISLAMLVGWLAGCSTTVSQPADPYLLERGDHHAGGRNMQPVLETERSATGGITAT